MEEHDEKADELEGQADRLDEQSDEVQTHIDQVRSDFEGKALKRLAATREMEGLREAA
jgi:hypothetical protein